METDHMKLMVDNLRLSSSSYRLVFKLQALSTHDSALHNCTIFNSVLKHDDQNGSKMLQSYMLAFLSHLSFVSSPQCSFFFLSAGCTSAWVVDDGSSFFSLLIEPLLCSLGSFSVWFVFLSGDSLVLRSSLTNLPF
uniref:Uncharacterized protein n=1 Tax=Opuntia streptacantha TaxID=393608 RepID=A0A7C9CFC6_OPUST